MNITDNGSKKVNMAKKHDRTLSLSRRSLLGGATALGAASVLNSAGADEANTENLPPNVP